MSGPHQDIPCQSASERFTCRFFDRLWARYRERVVHVAAYEQLVQEAKSSFVNDHIAFRTFALQQPTVGIATLSRLFEGLGYRAAGCYDFRDKHLNAIHYQHPNSQFPKLFISELKTWELEPATRSLIQELLASHRGPCSDETLAQLQSIESSTESRQDALLESVVEQIEQLPWQPPERSQLLALNESSQYAAWVAVHGYNVNHFTSLINSHGPGALDDIEKTVAALAAAGVPMKEEIEGLPGSKLRQSATQAAMVDVAVRESGELTTIPWTYAYFELAERGQVTDPETGRTARFEGFLGAQATHLFEMTKKSNS